MVSCKGRRVCQRDGVGMRKTTVEVLVDVENGDPPPVGDKVIGTPSLRFRKQ
jgi:hypothetical protein